MARVKKDKNNKSEAKKNTNNKKTFILILLIVLCLSIGYAALTTRLEIWGDVKILKWHPRPQGEFKVQWENLQILNGSNLQVTPAYITDDKQDVNYEIKFNTPGQVFEFTVDAVNRGDFTAVSTDATNSVLTDAQKRYLVYTVLEEDAEPTPGRTLIKNASARYKVRIEFKKDITNDDLRAASNTTLDLNFLIPYVQS